MSEPFCDTVDGSGQAISRLKITSDSNGTTAGKACYSDEAKEMLIARCTNKGTVSSDNGGYLGGIVGGTTAGTLNPAGTATRAQFAVILWRFYQTTAV